ncbi:hypothetical protein OS493_008396 [Desmophyllum pertusum]|uniref:Uncharacterized protein n=1 Tax=Desmophyllum pertusum TaxID=174260 RepID=A0A9X0A4U8_9CNID|nr:hypothetical protein OS493_008396 [Desmophyllum pertusum]
MATQAAAIWHFFKPKPPACTEARVLYHRLMLPKWLRNNAEWSSPYEGDDLNLVILPDSANWENIFRVPLIPKGHLKDDDDVTVTIKVGAILAEQKPRYPMSYMISDEDFAMGFQLLDANNDDGLGPYRAVEGEPGKTLRNANVHVAATTNSKNNPDQFELTLKPGEAFGSAYSAIDDGHMIVAQFSDNLSLSNGLTFELYRFQSVESYTINFIEITVYMDSNLLELWQTSSSSNPIETFSNLSSSTPLYQFGFPWMHFQLYSSVNSSAIRGREVKDLKFS